jgi:GNAT superfamily N-acetyltransferase
MVDLEIHAVSGDELGALVTAGGQAGYFRDRLERQRRGLGVLIAAWRGTRAVGSVYLWLERAEEPEIREHLPGVPLITHLEVFAATDRRQGIGTRLVLAAEATLRDRGHPMVALAVELSNDDAARLYGKLGYRDWGSGRVDCVRREWLADGELSEMAEKCDVLTRVLL